MEDTTLLTRVSYFFCILAFAIQMGRMYKRNILLYNMYCVRNKENICNRYEKIEKTPKFTFFVNI